MTSILEEIRKENPVVLDIPNMVTPQKVADAISYVGGSPIMCDSSNEGRDLVAIANSLVLNLGTMNDDNVKLDIIAGQAANNRNLPVIVDPVAVSASELRTEVFKKISNEVNIDILRGNVGEIAFTAGIDWGTRGIDADDGNGDRVQVAKMAAKQFHSIVVISGVDDVISDGSETYVVHNGSKELAINVGSGDVLDGVLGVVAAHHRGVHAVALGTAIISVAGELAEGNYPADPASFEMEFFNNLYKLDDHQLSDEIRIEKINN